MSVKRYKGIDERLKGNLESKVLTISESLLPRGFRRLPRERRGRRVRVDGARARPTRDGRRRRWTPAAAGRPRREEGGGRGPRPRPPDVVPRPKRRRSARSPDERRGDVVVPERCPRKARAGLHTAESLRQRSLDVGRECAPKEFRRGPALHFEGSWAIRGQVS